MVARTKVVRSVLFGDGGLLVGLGLSVSLGGGPPGAVGLEPQGIANGVRHVVHGDDRADAKLAALATDGMIVIELRAAHADGDVEDASAAVAVSVDGAVGGDNGITLVLGHLIRDVIRRRFRLLPESDEISLQLVLKDTGEIRRKSRGKQQKQKITHKLSE